MRLLYNFVEHAVMRFIASFIHLDDVTKGGVAARVTRCARAPLNQIHAMHIVCMHNQQGNTSTDML
jgi:hypothetical protein